MRNYVLSYGLEWNQHWDNGIDPPADFLGHMFGKSKADVISRANTANEILKTFFPNPEAWTFSFPNDPVKVYWMMDKANMIKMLSNEPDVFWYSGLLNTDQPTQILRNQPEKSPRQGWTDTAGVRRKAPPSDQKAIKFDFSGAQTLVENFLSIMQALITVYSSRGDKRTVGILKDLLNKFLSGQEAIPDILDQLRKLFII